jgi:DNA invertase Pin-like site-specific DNA recombinase
MPKKSFKPNHLELRYRTYFALLVVPKDVRHIIGKSKFFETTGNAIKILANKGVGVRETCRQLGIGSATYYKVIRE